MWRRLNSSWKQKSKSGRTECPENHCSPTKLLFVSSLQKTTWMFSKSSANYWAEKQNDKRRCAPTPKPHRRREAWGRQSHGHTCCFAASGPGTFAATDLNNEVKTVSRKFTRQHQGVSLSSDAWVRVSPLTVKAWTLTWPLGLSLNPLELLWRDPEEGRSRQKSQKNRSFSHQQWSKILPLCCARLITTSLSFSLSISWHSFLLIRWTSNNVWLNKTDN